LTRRASCSQSDARRSAPTGRGNPGRKTGASGVTSGRVPGNLMDCPAFLQALVGVCKQNPALGTRSARSSVRTFSTKVAGPAANGRGRSASSLPRKRSAKSQKRLSCLRAQLPTHLHPGRQASATRAKAKRGGLRMSCPQSGRAAHTFRSVGSPIAPRRSLTVNHAIDANLLPSLTGPEVTALRCQTLRSASSLPTPPCSTPQSQPCHHSPLAP
jgi:hypothetical protein